MLLIKKYLQIGEGIKTSDGDAQNDRRTTFIHCIAL